MLKTLMKSLRRKILQMIHKLNSLKIKFIFLTGATNVQEKDTPGKLVKCDYRWKKNFLH